MCLRKRFVVVLDGDAVLLFQSLNVFLLQFGHDGAAGCACLLSRDAADFILNRANASPKCLFLLALAGELDGVFGHVQPLKQLNSRRQRTGFGEPLCLVNGLPCLLSHNIHLCLGSDACLCQPVAQEQYRVALAILFQLLLRAITLLVGKRVPEVAIGARLHQHRTLALATHLNRLRHLLLHVQHVHAVALQSGNAVSLCPLDHIAHPGGIRCFGYTAVVPRHGHRVQVILANENHRQAVVRDRSKVQRFMEGAGVHRAVAEEAKHHRA